LLYEQLHDVFDTDYPPIIIHRFLARLARGVREDKEARECMMIITTNYDDSLERAFADGGEPYELLTYIARGEDRGRFRHVTADGESVVIRVPHEYVNLRLDQRTVIAKILGSVDRVHGEDSFVITEDHYIDYVSRTANLANLFPAPVVAKLRTSHLLFAGCSLRDWNFRTMLYRLRGEHGVNHFISWALQENPDLVDRAMWDEHGVHILPVSVTNFIAAAEQRLVPQYESATIHHSSHRQLITDHPARLPATGTAAGRSRARQSDQLSPPEAAVAQLLQAGRTNRQIAQKLHISVKTAEIYLGHIYQKLGIRNRWQLAERDINTTE
jgi:DNA-binding CsgD family transcriptional regulator